MDQLILDLTPTPLPAFDNFLAERNREVITALTAEAGERFIYLWGEPGCGKTHLLQAWIAHAERLGRASIYLDGKTEHLPDFAREASFIAVDHVDDLAPDDQITLFSFYNSLKESGESRLLMAGRQPPMALAVRDDLRTRLGWGLVFEVKALSDEDKLAALRSHAASRQLSIPDDVYRYLLTHWRRDLSSLIGMIDILDRYSLAMRRPITVPLVKNVLQTASPEP
ncbi:MULTISPECIES: DnaA regulatory inactivator Hda [Chromobacterium]|uniref:DnaA regulatory inactivator Hda n=6 Tax=Chromobacterium TaxID=535 RepID=A0A1W0CT15_9NEIS|nr:MULTISPECIES: DnaA regulatory inactivator Hda [Chromobacterium]AXT45442.1 DnaA regulatory inactivator Hda [Chromobacterium rhizoryzae]KMN36911.1 chromosomal replication initiator protein DnaA [Chromobacterium sp. LK1]KMN76328.1 chromosomal replication initiator protein DnaA [Chromobacterium sp. LK11]MBK0414591.1 DnaA regulatory inactivator Hda [Chromobacterium haemolyticum]MBN3004628.1 DnaA regulatory inactivator Hda [Chromobacterium alkanivorans]